MARTLLILILLALPGCFSYRPGDPRPSALAAAPAPVAWPERSLDEMRKLHDATPEDLPDYTIPNGATLDAYTPDTRAKLLALPRVPVRANTLTPHGLFRAYDIPDRTSHTHTAGAPSPFHGYFAGLISGFEPNAAFNSEWSIQKQSVRVTTNDDGTVSAEAAPWQTPRDLAPLQGIQIRIPEPDEIPPKTKGTLLHFNGLLSTKYERAAIDKLRDLGWAIVLFDTEPTVTGRDYTLTVRDTGDAPESVLRKVYRANIRFIRETNAQNPGTFTEPTFEEFVKKLAETSRPIKRPGYAIASDDDAPRVGRAIAQDVDSLIAEHAYAAEAALNYIKANRPDLPRPYVVAGFSAGAQIAPGVALRLKDDLGALLLVAPAMNVFELSRRSVISNGGIDVFPRDGFEITEQAKDAVGASYLRSANLDAGAIAPALDGLPTLVVYADDDDWVPTDLTEQLIQRLGVPDRMIHDGDHRTLFFFLKSQMGKVSRWLTDNAR